MDCDVDGQLGQELSINRQSDRVPADVMDHQAPNRSPFALGNHHRLGRRRHTAAASLQREQRRRDADNDPDEPKRKGHDPLLAVADGSGATATFNVRIPFLPLVIVTNTALPAGSFTSGFSAIFCSDCPGESTIVCSLLQSSIGMGRTRDILERGVVAKIVTFACTSPLLSGETLRASSVTGSVDPD